MELTVQRKLAASVLKCSPKRVWLDETRLAEVKEAITKQDLRALVSRGVVQMKPYVGVSRARTRASQSQKRKGRQKGQGSRKGRSTARLSDKETWMIAIRLQRAFLNELKSKGMLTNAHYRELYMKCKGGYFRSKRHVKLYMDEHNMIISGANAKK